MFSNFTRWVGALWRWLGEGCVGVMGVLVVAAALLWGMYTFCSEMSIRSSGFGLQLVGMVFAINGLLAIRAHFDKPLLRTLLRDWLKKFPRWKPKPIVGGLNAVMSSDSAMHARGYVGTPDKPDQPLEQRVEAIIKNLERVRDELQQHAKSLDDLRRDHEQQKTEVERTTDRLESSIRADLDKLHTADVLLSQVGLVWLTIGILLGTLAPELAALLGCS